ncbi:MAG: GNAT family N-acetyltransferase [Thermomicrobiales bacterium]
MTETRITSLAFKEARTDTEFELIHRLNHETFVEEIPQHQRHPDRRLVDRFHAENTYLIALDGERLAGMIAVRDARPFSLDGKVADLDGHLPPHRSLCEIRLLAVRRQYRTGRVLVGLMGLMHRHCVARGYDLGVISGTTGQVKLYAHLGFVPFGPLVGTDEARFQPMFLSLARAETQAVPFLKHDPMGRGGTNGRPDAGPPSPALMMSPERHGGPPVSFLPGPVAIAAEVRAALAAEPVHHRDPALIAILDRVRAGMLAMTGAAGVAVLPGSGTLANDAIAAQLAAAGGRGVVLTNGEFGDRLVDHATRAGLVFETVSAPWGSAIDPATVERALAGSSGPVGWCWATHCETSTGVLNHFDAWREMAIAHGVRLCLDCMSSLGTVPVDLTGVTFAAATAGKGLGAYAGLAFVFHDATVRPTPAVPRSLDLGPYLAGDGVPFTLPSPLVLALDRALAWHRDTDVLTRTARLGARLRAGVEAIGLPVVAPEEVASPAVLTIGLPPTFRSGVIADGLREAGYLANHRSAYLERRNLLQLCLMGDIGEEDVDGVLEALGQLVAVRGPSVSPRGDSPPG